MDNNNATEKFNTNMESSEPGLQDRLYKVTGANPGVQKRLGKCYYGFYPPILYLAKPSLDQPSHQPNQT